MKKLRVTVEGKVYEVLVEMLDEGSQPAPFAASHQPTSVATPVAAAAVQAPTASAPKTTAAAGAGDVVSPLAGKVVSIDVKTGQTVEEGAQVATVEAMKMNTYVFAPKTGRVDAILVNPGEGVEEGTVLIRLV